jgi:hypothetical protein
MNSHWLKVSSLYEDLRKERSLLENEELGEVYKRVIELFNKSMEEENYLQSFILIQNLYEDRLYVLYKYVVESKSGNSLSLEYYHQTVDLKRIIRELHSPYLIFDDRVKKTLDKSVDIRNRFIHFSFIKPDVYSKNLCNTFYILFREVDKEIQNFKKTLQ